MIKLKLISIINSPRELSEGIVKESIESFLNHLVVEKGFSRNTLEAYRNDLGQFLTYVEGRANGTPMAWDKVDLSLLVDYVSSLRSKRSYRDTTTARKVAALKSFFNFLVEEETVDQDPTEYLTAPRVGRSLPKFLSEEEVDRLLEEAAKEKSPEGRRDWAILELLYATGLRVTELVSLNTQDINLHDGYIRCTGKGSKERIVYVYPRALHVLKAYIDDARPSLLSLESDGHVLQNGRAQNGKTASSKEEKALFVNHRGDRLTRQWVWNNTEDLRQKGLGGQADNAAHSAPQLRDPHAAWWRLPAARPGAVGPLQHNHHPGLHPPHFRAPPQGVREKPPQVLIASLIY